MISLQRKKKYRYKRKIQIVSQICFEWVNILQLIYNSSWHIFSFIISVVGKKSSLGYPIHMASRVVQSIQFSEKTEIAK